MHIHFSQIYVKPGIRFPFTHLFQKKLSDEITRLVTPSPRFASDYGSNFDLIIRISAKDGIDDCEIRGPTVIRKAKDVEYTIFLPFDVIAREQDETQAAMRFLLRGVYSVFELLDIDKASVVEKADSLIAEMCSDRTMVEQAGLS